MVGLEDLIGLPQGQNPFFSFSPPAPLFREKISRSDHIYSPCSAPFFPIDHLPATRTFKSSKYSELLSRTLSNRAFPPRSSPLNEISPTTPQLVFSLLDESLRHINTSPSAAFVLPNSGSSLTYLLGSRY
jgi:hypothetical protein